MEKSLTVAQMQEMQRELYEVNREKWTPRNPEHAKDYMLYMIEELGEAIAIFKKKGNEAIMNEDDVRYAFVEEMVDVLMYYHEVCISYGISPSELSDAYESKIKKNLSRNYSREYEKMFKDK